MLGVVSLIHGARRPYRFTPNRSWMDDFAAYLRQNGARHVSTFSWSGGFTRGLQRRDAPRYADHLLHDYRLAQASGSVLSIVAKSLGALIAEQALVMLMGKIEVHVFLRIGVPDRRVAIPVSGVGRIVNVTSDRDRLYRYGLFVVPRYVDHTRAGAGTTVSEIRLTGLSHGDLTRCSCAPGAQETTYSLYRELLSMP